MGVQLLAVVSIMTWTALSTLILLLLIDKTMGLRVSVEEEIMGADLVEHGIGLHSRVCVVPDKPSEPCNLNNMNNNTTENPFIGTSEPLPVEYHPDLKVVERRVSHAYGSRMMQRLEYPVSRLERAIAIEERLEPMIKRYVSSVTEGEAEQQLEENNKEMLASDVVMANDVVIDVTALQDLKPIGHYFSNNAAFLGKETEMSDQSPPDKHGKIKGL